MIRTRVDSLLETKRKNMQDIRYKKNRREFLSTSAKSLALLGIARHCFARWLCVCKGI